MNDKHVSPLLRDLKFLADRRMLDGDLGQSLLENVGSGITDPLVVSTITEWAQRCRTKEFFEPPPPFQLPDTDPCDGDFVLGSDSGGRPIYVPFAAMGSPSLTCGTTGSAKTTKGKFHLAQIARRIPVLCFEFRKANEYASLQPHLKQLDVELLVIPARSLRLNPFEVPPAVDKWTWARVVTEMLKRILLLPPRSAKLWKVIIDYFFRTGKPFCIFDVYEAVVETPKANAQAKDAIVDSLDPIVTGLFDCLRCYQGFTAADFATLRSVIGCSGNAHEEKDFVSNLLIESLFQYQMARGISNPSGGPLIHVACDESAHLVSDNDSGISDIIQVCRGTGLSLELSVQSADISRKVLSNSVNRYLGLCGSYNDYRTIGSSMGLTTEQVRYMSQNLCPGSWICSLSHPALRRPFELKIPDFKTAPVRHDLTDLGSLTRRKVVCADRYDNWVPFSQRKIVISTKPDDDGVSSKLPAATFAEGTATGLTESQRRFLHICIHHQDKSSTEITKEARLASKTANKIRKRLIELGYLTEEQLHRSSGRGRPATMLKPTSKAFEVFEDE